MTEPNLRKEKGLIVFLRRNWVWPTLVVIALGTAFALTELRPQRAVTAEGETLDLMAGLSDGLERSKSVLTAQEASTPAQIADRGPRDSLQRKVVSTANLEIKVKSAGRAVDDLAKLATGAGGFVQSSNIAAMDGGGQTAAVVLRIPAERFETFLTTVGRLGEVSRKEVNGQDVTEEYVDYQARLRAWESEERQLYVIMARAKTVGEVLAVRDRLSQVRETIEQLQGKIRYYDYNVALATIAVSLHEGNQPVLPPWILRELADLGRALYGSIRGLIQALLVLVPWGLAGWGLWLIGRRVLRKPQQ